MILVCLTRKTPLDTIQLLFRNMLFIFGTDILHPMMRINRRGFLHRQDGLSNMKWVLLLVLVVGQSLSLIQMFRAPAHGYLPLRREMLSLYLYVRISLLKIRYFLMSRSERFAHLNAIFWMEVLALQLERMVSSL